MEPFKNTTYQLSRNFYLFEFKVSKDYPDLADQITFSVEDVKTLSLLCLTCIQPIRDKFGITHIFSGKRSEELNMAVGGHETSDHLTCNAADILCSNFNSEQVFKWLVNESGIDYRQVIYYPDSNFIHISCNIPEKDLKHDALVFVGDQKYIKFREYYGGKIS